MKANVSLRMLVTALTVASSAQGRVSVCALLGDNGNQPWNYSDFAAELGGRGAAIYHQFFQLAPQGFAGNDPDNFVAKVRENAPNSEVLLTLELRNDQPTEMSDLGDAAYQQIAQRLAAWNDEGISIHLRILHEPNGLNSDGSTYFKQQTKDPKVYVRVFRGIAIAVHRATSIEERRAGGRVVTGFTRTMWSVMPQHRDSKTDVTRYFPGRDVVDEVGLTFVSQVPVKLPPRKDGKPNRAPLTLADKLNYQFVGAGERTSPKSFYMRYCKEMNLPLYIAETSRPTPYGMDGDAEVATKLDWFDQLYNENMLRSFPKLRGICYLEMDRAGYGKDMHYGVFGRRKDLTARARARLAQLAEKGLVKFA